MYFKYDIDGSIHNVWVSPYRKTVDVYDGKIEHTCDIVDNHFTYRGHKIDLDDFISFSVDDFNEKLRSSNEFITSDDLISTILAEGIKNIVFIVPMIPITKYENDVAYPKRCVIDETNYALRDNNKIEFLVCDDDYRDDVVSRRSFNIDDVISLMKDEIILMRKLGA